MDDRHSLRESDASFARKTRTVKFIFLGMLLFLFADIIGKWFVPEGESVPGLFSAMIWCISIALGCILYYGNRRIDRPAVKIAAALMLYIIYLLLLHWLRFYAEYRPELTGYRISMTLLPAIGIVICSVTRKFLRWYGGFIKRTFRLETTHSAWFIGAFVVLAVLSVFIFIGGYRLRGCLGQQGMDLYQLKTEGEINHNRDHSEPFRQYSSIFNDLNDTQMEAARANGLKRIPRDDEVEGNRSLRLIETNRYYRVDKLTHSVPYLVPKAAGLVDDIGRAFQDSLFNRGYNRDHRIVVTSVLRTGEQVKQLRRSNVNSTENSCHCYGTTIDISYLTFDTPQKGRAASQQKMREVLMQVMYDLRNQGRCYVKYEKKQSCLHITVR
ncbi:MAG: DUF5715 family protein [Bacteroidaceae bacterium]|nr:DUF5715 family protein [Bacteroidaceae bacterium]